MKFYTKTLLYFSAFSLLLVATGCKKKCDLGTDITSGDIKTKVIVVPLSGYLTSNLTEEQYLITASHIYADQFKISTDGGVTKTPVNYNEYSIICYPTTVNCIAQFDRNVSIDDENQTIHFRMRVTDCGKCDEKRYIENYYAIRAVPDTYTIKFDIETTTVE